MNASAFSEQQLKKDESSQVMASIRDLRKSFGDREVLKGVNLDLYRSENLVILGRSGTGKSVLIKCMVGLMKPDSGTIEVLGKNVFSLNPKELNAWKASFQPLRHLVTTMVKSTCRREL